MRRRTLKLVAKLGGFPMVLGELMISKFAKMREAETELVCPNCFEKPTWKGEYICPKCNSVFNHWSKLKRILAETKEPVIQEKLEDQAMAHVFVMKAEDFAKKYADATLEEYGVIAKDPQTAINIKKLLVAVERLGMVVVIHYNDTYEERVVLLTVSSSNRVILKEIIPMNLAEITETLRVDLESIKEQDITEAQMLLKMLPEATEETFTVHDHRTIGLREIPLETPKVQSLNEILAQLQK